MEALSFSTHHPPDSNRPTRCQWSQPCNCCQNTDQPPAGIYQASLRLKDARGEPEGCLGRAHPGKPENLRKNAPPGRSLSAGGSATAIPSPETTYSSQGSRPRVALGTASVARRT